MRSSRSGATPERVESVAESPSITLAVVTYRRPDDLSRLLPALAQQATAVPWRAGVLVVDNDPERSADRVVRGFREAHPGLVVHYVPEPVPGIAAARNRALQAADGDLLVFIDDDEEPTPEWLVQLMDTYLATGAAAVAGPVEPIYPAPPRRWIADGPFHASPRFPDRFSLKYGATSNLLLDLEQVRCSGVRMPDLGTRGGEDVIFTSMLVRSGASMVWSERALVYEWIPPARIRARWVLTRSVYDGNTSAVRQLTAGTALTRRLAITGAGLLRVAIGAGRTGYALLTRSSTGTGSGLHTLMRGVGMCLGAWDVVYDGYARPGSPRWQRAAVTVHSAGSNVGSQAAKR